MDRKFQIKMSVKDQVWKISVCVWIKLYSKYYLNTLLIIGGRYGDRSSSISGFIKTARGSVGDTNNGGGPQAT